MIRGKLANLYLKIRKRPDSFELLEKTFNKIIISRVDYTRKNRWQAEGLISLPAFRHPLSVIVQGSSIVEVITSLVIEGPPAVGKVERGELIPDG